jgi:hypothetical protein
MEEERRHNRHPKDHYQFCELGFVLAAGRVALARVPRSDGLQLSRVVRLQRLHVRAVVRLQLDVAGLHCLLHRLLHRNIALFCSAPKGGLAVGLQLLLVSTRALDGCECEKRGAGWRAGL